MSPSVFILQQAQDERIPFQMTHYETASKENSIMKMVKMSIACCIGVALSAVAIQAQTILFVRGGVGTVKWVFNYNDGQAADITNTRTASGNCGWSTLATGLRNLGYTIEQIKEGDTYHAIGTPVSL